MDLSPILNALAPSNPTPATVRRARAPGKILHRLPQGFSRVSSSIHLLCSSKSYACDSCLAADRLPGGMALRNPSAGPHLCERPVTRLLLSSKCVCSHGSVDSWDESMDACVDFRNGAKFLWKSIPPGNRPLMLTHHVIDRSLIRLPPGGSPTGRNGPSQSICWATSVRPICYSASFVVQLRLLSWDSRHALQTWLDIRFIIQKMVDCEEGVKKPKIITEQNLDPNKLQRLTVSFPF
ncbi:hypothetical protein BHM03_00023813 [Ensete ventricosum]|nr:hypothetical protein BHM03_00023813 [Ensete ventricosum]